MKFFLAVVTALMATASAFAPAAANARAGTIMMAARGPKLSFGAPKKSAPAKKPAAKAPPKKSAGPTSKKYPR